MKECPNKFIDIFLQPTEPVACNRLQIDNSGLNYDRVDTMNYGFANQGAKDLPRYKHRKTAGKNRRTW